MLCRCFMGAAQLGWSGDTVGRKKTIFCCRSLARCHHEGCMEDRLQADLFLSVGAGLGSFAFEQEASYVGESSRDDEGLEAV